MGSDRWFTLLLWLSVLGLGGCNRAFWRDHADRESYAALTEKQIDPRWQLPRIDVTPDRRSRFYSPYDPDKPPMPPDDEAANIYMKLMSQARDYGAWPWHPRENIKGSNVWHQFGQSFSVENPQWYVSLGLPPNYTQCLIEGAPLPDKGPGLEKLTLKQALELSYIHSREYQNEIENIYLSALDLTQQRFVFDLRYLGTAGRPPSYDGTFTSGPNGQNNYSQTVRGGLSQNLPAGGQWAVELLNNTVWMFTGDNQMSTASTISYSLTQPLLRGGGKAVALEGLTQAERNLLYDIRGLARFRHLFFVETVTDDASGGYLGILRQRRTILNQVDNVYRLEQQAAYLKAVSTQPRKPEEPVFGLPAAIAEAGFPAVLTGPVTETTGRLTYDPQSETLTWEGPMSEAQEQALRELAGAPETPADLLGSLMPLQLVEQARRDFFRAAALEIIQQLRGGDTEVLEVTQLLSQLASAQQRLLQLEQGLESSLEQFKLHLGLPPDLPLSLDESLLDQFELIDPKLTAVERELNDAIDVTAGIDIEDPDLQAMREALTRLEELKKRVDTDAVDSIKADFEQIDALLKQNGKDQDDEEGDPEETEGTGPWTAESGDAEDRGDGTETTAAASEKDGQQFNRTIESEEDLQRLRTNVENDRRLFESALAPYRQDFLSDFTSIESRLKLLRQELDRNDLTQTERVIVLDELKKLREDLLKVPQSLQVIQINLRVELIPLQPFTMTEDQVVQAAICNRLDLMNVRAQVMDARRQVEVTANALESELDVFTSGEIRTPGDGVRPFDFRRRNSVFRAGVRFTTPLDQIDERNAYRAALINYDRARRAYIAQEDTIKFQVRQNWRLLQVNRENFDTARLAVRVAARQYDQAVEQSTAPGTESQQNRGLNLLNALSSVLSAQDNLINIWVSYEQLRLRIYRDTGLMVVDERGIWVDDFYQSDIFGTTSELSSGTFPGQECPNPGDFLAPFNENHLESTNEPDLMEVPGGLPNNSPAPLPRIIPQSELPELQAPAPILPDERPPAIPAPVLPEGPPVPLLNPPAQTNSGWHKSKPPVLIIPSHYESRNTPTVYPATTGEQHEPHRSRQFAPALPPQQSHDVSPDAGGSWRRRHSSSEKLPRN